MKAGKDLRHAASYRAMSLVELLVTMVVMLMLLTLLFGVVAQSQQVLSQTNRAVSSAQTSRQVFQVLREKLRSATLASTLKYFDTDHYSFGTTSSSIQMRPFSELTFYAGPSATLLNREVNEFPGDAIFWPSRSGEAQLSGHSVQGLLEGLGCLVRYGTDASDAPSFLRPWLSQDQRYRLLLHREAPEVFAHRLHVRTGLRWYHDLLPENIDPASGRAVPQTQVMGENVVALLVQPLQASGSPYAFGSVYDSFRWLAKDAKEMEATHGDSYTRLPAALRVGLVMLSPSSAQRLAEGAGATPKLGNQLLHLKQSEDWEAELAKVKGQREDGLDLELHETIITLPRRP